MSFHVACACCRACHCMPRRLPRLTSHAALVAARVRAWQPCCWGQFCPCAHPPSPALLQVEPYPHKLPLHALSERALRAKHYGLNATAPELCAELEPQLRVSQAAWEVCSACCWRLVAGALLIDAGAAPAIGPPGCSRSSILWRTSYASTARPAWSCRGTPCELLAGIALLRAGGPLPCTWCAHQGAAGRP